MHYYRFLIWISHDLFWSQNSKFTSLLPHFCMFDCQSWIVLLADIHFGSGYVVRYWYQPFPIYSASASCLFVRQLQKALSSSSSITSYWNITLLVVSSQHCHLRVRPYHYTNDYRTLYLFDPRFWYKADRKKQPCWFLLSFLASFGSTGVAATSVGLDL